MRPSQILNSLLTLLLFVGVLVWGALLFVLPLLKAGGKLAIPWWQAFMPWILLSVVAVIIIGCLKYGKRGK